MVNVKGKPVTLYYEDRKTGEKKDLLPRFFVTGYKAPERVEYWPKNPAREAERLSVSVAELKHVIGKVLPGQTRFDHCYWSNDRRMRRSLMQGQCYEIVSEHDKVADLEGESHVLRPTTVLLATEPFSVEDVKKNKGTVTIMTRGKGEKNIPIQDDGDGPYVIVHERQRPIIVLFEQDLLKKAMLMFSYLEKKEREDIMKRHVLSQREIRTAQHGKDYSEATRAKAGGSASEADDTAEAPEDEVSTGEADAPTANA